MKKSLLVIGFCALVLSLTAAAVPQYINYQGVLRDSAGDLVTGNKSMTFTLYDASTGGSSLWTMTSSEVAVNNGLYNVKLGPLNSSHLGAGSRWLQVAVGSDTLSPRLEVLAVAYAVTAGSAESASTVSGYSVGSTGNNIIPVTDSSGKLNVAVIPAGSTHALTADYATTSGTATNAANADAVDSYSANNAATANQLLALDGNKMFKGMAVSAEAAGNVYSMFINGGKLGITAGADQIAGVSSVPTGVGGAVVTCNKVTNNSIILLTVGTGATPDQTNTTESLKVFDISAGTSFTVKTLDENNSSGAAIHFGYLVIN
ncbi:MAG: hypothetical protein JW782_05805 [Candidatus Saganbacteria bacterium]|nr:hypothetical protein [Candidatus Saganbacteria bacterium]